VVDRPDYPNALVFDADHHDEFMRYLRFKLPFVAPDWPASEEVPAATERASLVALSREGRPTLAKNDAALRCRRPRCP